MGQKALDPGKKAFPFVTSVLLCPIPLGKRIVFWGGNVFFSWFLREEIILAYERSPGFGTDGIGFRAAFAGLRQETPPLTGTARVTSGTSVTSVCPSVKWGDWAGQLSFGSSDLLLPLGLFSFKCVTRRRPGVGPASLTDWPPLSRQALGLKRPLEDMCQK